MLTVADVAAHLDLSERRVYELQSKGVIAKAERGGHDLDGVRVAYIRHLRDNASGRAPQGELDPAQERARKDRALAEQTEMKNEVARGRLVDIEAVGMLVEREYTVVRAYTLALPSKVCAKFETDRREELHAIITGLVTETLTALASPDQMEVVKEAKTKRTATGKREAERAAKRLAARRKK